MAGSAPAIRHGLSGTKMYQAYHVMLGRCRNPRNSKYGDYGGRGITVCSRWSCKEMGYLNFLEDMGERPEGKTLERSDVNGNYCPENCIWASNSVQVFNRRVTRKNSTGRVGIYARGNKFYVKVMKDGVEHWGGTYASVDAAIPAVEALELKLYNHSRAEQ